MKAQKILSTIGTSILFLVLMLCVPKAQALENEIWISPLGTANTGASGTPSDPFRCPDSTSLKTVLTSVLVNNNTTLHFMAGTFQVYNTGIIPLPGWKLRGAGIDNTILQMTAGTVTNQISVVGMGSGNMDGVEITDLTIDCNFQNESNAPDLTAIELAGSNIRITRVKAINWGTRHAGSECFPFFTHSVYGYSSTNCIIEDCIVTQPAPVTFADGATAMVSGVNYTTIRDCIVCNVTAGSGTGMPAYFNAYGAGGTALGLIMRHNQAYNLTGGARGIYRDTYNGQDIVIEDNTFDNVSACIFFNMLSYNLTGVVIKNNVLRPAEGGTGINYYTGEASNTNLNAYVSNLLVLQNVIYPCSTATNVTAIALNTRMTATVMNNFLQGGGTGADYSINYPNDPSPDNAYPHPMQLKTWTGNVNSAGTQLVYSSNSDGWEPGDEVSIVFTPTSAGWYRILFNGYMSGSIKLESEFWLNASSDTEFWFRTDPYATTDAALGEIVETRSGGYYVGSTQITEVRIAMDTLGSIRTTLDLHIPDTTGAEEIRVTLRGKFKGALLTTPTLVTTTPDLSLVVGL